MKIKADLHTHSTFSDGDMTPSELVRLCKETGINVFSLTDHDCIDGLSEAKKACEEYGIRFIPGVEISAKETREIHILGYNFDYTNKEFIEELQKIRELRHRRNRLIISALKKKHLPINEEELNSKNTPGRKEIARLMVKRGYVKNISEAFEKYIGFGGPAYINAERPSPEQVIRLINKYGGMAVLAHPYKTGIDENALPEFIERLKSYGLKGVEVYYPTHSEENISFLKKITKENKLYMTGGSDFHDRNGIITMGEENYLFDEGIFNKYLH